MSVICDDITEFPTIEYNYCKRFVYATPSTFPPVPIASRWITKPNFLPAKYKRYADEILNFVVRPDDVWVIANAKCGTTWTQEMIWMVCNDLDYEADSKMVLMHRYVYLEADIIFDKPEIYQSSEFSCSIERANELPSPRYIKSHLSAELLPWQLWTVKPKIVYTARNPKDAALSFYYHLRNMHGYKGTLDEFLEAYLADKISFAPFHSHVLSFWNMRHEENILFLTFEDMKLNMETVLKRVMHHFQKTYSDYDLEKLRKHLHFDSMRSKPSISNDIMIRKQHAICDASLVDEDFRFLRKGEAGGYKTEMSDEMIMRFGNWSKVELINSDFKFQC